MAKSLNETFDVSYQVDFLAKLLLILVAWTVTTATKSQRPSSFLLSPWIRRGVFEGIIGRFCVRERQLVPIFIGRITSCHIGFI